MKPEMSELLERAIAVWNGADPSLLEHCLHKHYVYHHYALREPLRGFESMKGQIATTRKAFPDFHLIVDEAFAEGEKFVVKWHWTGTHRGEFRGIPASGKRVTQHGVNIVHMRGNLALEEYCVADMLTLLRQIEALPSSLK
jgi:steroid delta-isomerase-like uncharacterized protein